MNIAAERRYGAIVVGAGPNGLAAAITLARAGRRVLVVEGRDTIGGGCRSAELTLPGFTHDICSAIHPGATNSTFMRSLPLQRYGLEWVYSPYALAHPFDDGTAAFLSSSVMQTSLSLRQDASAYRKLMMPIVRNWDKIGPTILGPLQHPCPPLRAGPLRYPGPHARPQARRSCLSRRARERSLRGVSRTLHAAPRYPRHLCRRSSAGHSRPCGWLADGTRWLSADRGRYGLLPARPGWRDCSGHDGGVARMPAGHGHGSVRRYASPACTDRGREVSRPSTKSSWAVTATDLECSK